jgi:hypothetical protein
LDEKVLDRRIKEGHERKRTVVEWMAERERQEMRGQKKRR